MKKHLNLEYRWTKIFYASRVAKEVCQICSVRNRPFNLDLENFFLCSTQNFVTLLGCTSQNLILECFFLVSVQINKTLLEMISIYLQPFPICLRATSNSTSNIQYIYIKSSQHTEKMKGEHWYLREK